MKRAAGTFDPVAFAGRLNLAMAFSQQTTRSLSAQIDLSPSTISRACRGWPDLSHAAFLKLDAWMREQEGRKRRTAA